MDSNAYKTYTCSRDLTYNYYFKAPQAGKPFLLFLHGFPSLSTDWKKEVTFFAAEGYGLIVPDMLGYGGTSKPTDPELYRSSLMCKDLVELVENEKADNVIVIGHDWGSKIASRLANYYPDRFSAYAFLAVGYLAPSVGEPHVPLEHILAMAKKFLGYESAGYWKFLGREGSHKIVEEHLDGFMNIVFAKDPKVWIQHFLPTDTLEPWLTSGQKTERGDYITDEELKAHTEVLRAGGMAGPSCYYKIMISSIDHDDNQSIQKENIPIQKPVFFGAALHDPVGPASLQKDRMMKTCANLTFKEYQTGHWVILEAANEVNRDLLAWIQSV